MYIDAYLFYFLNKELYVLLGNSLAFHSKKNLFGCWWKRKTKLKNVETIT